MNDWLAMTMDEWLAHKVWNNELWRWLVVLGILALSVVVGRAVSYILQRQALRLQKHENLHVLSLVIQSVAAPAAMFILAGALYFSSTFVDLTYQQVVGRQVHQDGAPVVQTITQTRSLEWFWMAVCNMLLVLAVSWTLYRMVALVEFFMQRWASRSQTPLALQMVPLVRQALRLLVVILAILLLATNVFHRDVTAIVAGLGIGGLAFALAAQNALSNLFGAVVIFADRPFQLGDTITIKGSSGQVVRIGFRSVRIKTVDGGITTIPNSIVAAEIIENNSRPATRRRASTLLLAHDNDPARIARAVEIVRELFEPRASAFAPDVSPQALLGECSPQGVALQITYCCSGMELDRFLAFNSEFTLELLRRFHAENIRLAAATAVSAAKS